MNVNGEQGRNLRQLVGPVGGDYLQRALPPGGVWAMLVLLLGIASLGALPALAATALVGSAVVVYWPQRGAVWPGHWRVVGLAVLAMVAWAPEPDLLSQWFEHGVALLLLALALATTASHVLQARRLARRLQQAADALDEPQLLALLPEEATAIAAAWRAGDDSRGEELAVVMHLAVMHAALRPQCRPL